MKRRLIWRFGAAGIAIAGGASAVPATAPLKCSYDQTAVGFETGGPTMQGQLALGHAASTCGNAPSTAVDNASTAYRYVKYSFENRTGSPSACVTVSLQEEPNFTGGQTVTGLQVAAYDSSNGKTGFDPTNPATNWLGDPGIPTSSGGTSEGHVISTVISFSANVSDTFDIVVNEFTANYGSPYHLTVANCGDTYVAGINQHWSIVDGGALTQTGGSYIITGSGFLTNGGNVNVSLQGVDASVSVSSDKALTVVPGAWPGDAADLMDAALGNIVVTVPAPTIDGGTIDQGDASVNTLAGAFKYYNWIPTTVSYPETPDPEAGAFDIYPWTYGTAVPLQATITPQTGYPIPAENPFPSGNLQFSLIGNIGGGINVASGCGCGMNFSAANSVQPNGVDSCAPCGDHIGAYDFAFQTPVTATGPNSASAASSWGFDASVGGLPFPPNVQTDGPTVQYQDGLGYTLYGRYLGDNALFLPTAAAGDVTTTLNGVAGIRVAPEPTTLGLSSSNTTPELYEVITLTATVATGLSDSLSSINPGHVRFRVGAANIPGCGAVATTDDGNGNLVATCSIPATGYTDSANSFTVTAGFTPVGSNLLASSNTVTETVTIDPTVVTMTGGTFTFGQVPSWNVYVSVDGGDFNGVLPSGTVTATDTTNSFSLACDAGVDDAGTAAWTCYEPDASTIIGTVFASASYAGTSETQDGGTTGLVPITVNRASTVTNTDAGATIAFGDPLTLRAGASAVDPNAAALQAVSGGLTFSYTPNDGGISVNLCTSVTLDGLGNADCVTGSGGGPAIPPGVTLYAAYGGGTYYTGSSSQLAITVTQADSGILLGDNTDGGQSTFGDPVQFSALVGSSDTNATGFAAPSGSVMFAVADGGTTLCTPSLSGSTATCSTSSLAPGAYSVVATYLGDINYTGSASTLDIITVNQAPSTVSITSPANDAGIIEGATYTLAAQVSSNDTNALGQALPGGTVTFSANSSPICTTGALSGSPATASCSGTAPGTTGPLTITAAYNGNANYAGSSATPVAITVVTPPPFDAGYDSGYDSGFDSGFDSGLDAGYDSGFDAGFDAGYDSGFDAGFDAGSDSGFDSGVDAGHDSGYDSGYDSGFDAGHDAGVDSSADSGSDAVIIVVDAGSDAATDAGTDAPVIAVDAGTDAPVTSDSGTDAPVALDSGADSSVADAGTDAGGDAGRDAAAIDAGRDAAANDAGSDANTDAAPAVDAGDDAGDNFVPPPNGGCGCRTAGSTGSTNAGPLALLGIALIAARRRNRR